LDLGAAAPWTDPIRADGRGHIVVPAEWLVSSALERILKRVFEPTHLVVTPPGVLGSALEEFDRTGIFPVAMAPRREGRVLRVRLESADGVPVSNAIFATVSYPSWRATTRTDEQGIALVHGLQTGIQTGLVSAKVVHGGGPMGTFLFDEGRVPIDDTLVLRLPETSLVRILWREGGAQPRPTGASAVFIATYASGITEERLAEISGDASVIAALRIRPSGDVLTEFRAVRGKPVQVSLVVQPDWSSARETEVVPDREVFEVTLSWDDLKPR
jgi:hypothetical protein